jgi:hypothetical protein
VSAPRRGIQDKDASIHRSELFPNAFIAACCDDMHEDSLRRDDDTIALCYAVHSVTSGHVSQHDDGNVFTKRAVVVPVLCSRRAAWSSDEGESLK